MGVKALLNIEEWKARNAYMNQEKSIVINALINTEESRAENANMNKK